MSGTKFKVKEYTQHTDSSGVVYEYGAEVTKEFPVTFVPSGTLSSTQVYGELRVEDGGTLHADSAVISEVSLDTLKAKTNLLEVTNSHGAGDGGTDNTPFIMSLTRPAQASGAIEVKEENTSSGAIAGARIAYQGDGSEDLGVTNPKYSLNISSLQAINRADGSSTQTAHNVLSFGPTGNAVRLESSDDLDLVATEKVTLQGSKAGSDDTGVLVTATGNCAISATEDISLTAADRIAIGTNTNCPIDISGSELTVLSGEISVTALGAIGVSAGVQDISISGGSTSISSSDELEITAGVSSAIKSTGTGQNYIEAGSGGVLLKTRADSNGVISLDSDGDLSLVSHSTNLTQISTFAMRSTGVSAYTPSLTVTTSDVSVETDNTEGVLVVSTQDSNKYRKGIKSEGGRLYVGELSNPSLFNTDGYCLEVFCFGTNDTSADYDTGDVYIRSAGSIQILTSESAEGTHDSKDIQFGFSRLMPGTGEAAITSRDQVHNIRVRIDNFSGDTHFDGNTITGGAAMTFSGGHAYLSRSEVAVGLAVDINGDYAEASSSPLSKKCAGIVINCQRVSDMREVNYISSTGSEPAEGDYLVYTASVGDTRTKNCAGFNICNENGEVQAGDLLVTSSTPGYLMKQDDDIMRSCTVGKAMEDVVFNGSGQATGVYGYIYCG